MSKIKKKSVPAGPWDDVLEGRARTSTETAEGNVSGAKVKLLEAQLRTAGGAA
jgi:hypothetical protein